MKNIACVILAAGKGTRMKSSVPKPLHKIHSRYMLEYLVDSVRSAGISKIALVVGHEKDKIKKVFKKLDIVQQKNLLGSGDAVKSTEEYFKNFEGDILVTCSDTPLLGSNILKELIKSHRNENNSATILTTDIEDPTGYGRIIRNDDGKIKKIVEDNDASLYEKAQKEINVGTYCFKKGMLFPNLKKVELNKKKKEYYLTDIIGILKKANAEVGAFKTRKSSECLGINSRIELAKAYDLINEKTIISIMKKGVTVTDPKSTSIGYNVKIGKDSVIYSNTVIDENVVIGENCKIGPFAHIKSGTEIDDNAEIGNFTDINRTKIGSGCKIKHKTYLGDAILGKNVNIGAGTITANYDGKNKNKTVIKDNAFIGVGSILIAPVVIGKGAVVGAGSVVTKNHDVPDGKTVIGIPAKIMEKK